MYLTATESCTQTWENGEKQPAQHPRPPQQQLPSGWQNFWGEETEAQTAEAVGFAWDRREGAGKGIRSQPGVLFGSQAHGVLAGSPDLIFAEPDLIFAKPDLIFAEPDF